MKEKVVLLREPVNEKPLNKLDGYAIFDTIEDAQEFMINNQEKEKAYWILDLNKLECFNE